LVSVTIPLKVCPKHEQAHRVTEPCPYCEDRPKSVLKGLDLCSPPDIEIRSLLSIYPRIALYSGANHVLWGVDPRIHAWLECPAKERYARKTLAVESCTVDYSGPLPGGPELQFSCGLTRKQTVFALKYLTRSTIVQWWEDL
jgi:hypothetical protein